MIRLLWIPVAGTVAAFIVILLAHEPREEDPAPVFPEPPPALPDDASDAPASDLSGRSPGGANADDATKPAKKPKPKAPPPELPPPPEEHFLRLEKDGSLVDLDSSRTFADGAAVIAELVREKVRDRIILSNGEGVEEAELEQILESLRAKFEVRKVYRAPEEKEE